jgi:hypothetical protein
MAGSEENTSCMFRFLLYLLDWQPAPGTEPQPAALRNDRFLISRMSTTYEEGLEPISTFQLCAAGRIGAGRPHTKESRREKL